MAMSWLLQVMPAQAALDVPQILLYQARLTDASRITVDDATLAMQFNLYDAVTGGVCKYVASGTCGTPTTVAVPVTDGIFNVELGNAAGSPATIAFADTLFDDEPSLFLEVIIAGETLTPRRRITSAAYAIQAGDSDLLDSLDTDNDGCITGCIVTANNVGDVIFTGETTSTLVGGGSVYVNPSAATADHKLFGIALGGSERFSVDEDGDVVVVGASDLQGSLANSGGDLSIADNLDISSGGLNVSGTQATTILTVAGTAGIESQMSFTDTLLANKTDTALYAFSTSSSAVDTFEYSLFGSVSALSEGGNNTAGTTNAVAAYGEARATTTTGYTTDLLIGTRGRVFMDGGGTITDMRAVSGTTITAGVGGVAVTTGYGGYFEETAATGTGYGAYGRAQGSATTNYGGYFKAHNATNNYGVYGLATSAGTVGYGGYFKSELASTNYAIYTDAGYVHIEGDGTATTPTFAGVGTASSGSMFVNGNVEIYNSALCVGGATPCADATGSAAGAIYADGAINASDFDLAEMFNSTQFLVAGEIVSASTGNEESMERASSSSIVLGAVSTEPGLVLGWGGENQYPIALAGRVPIKISDENGSIAIGDRIAVSSIPGVGMKATEAGEVVGVALQASNGGVNDAIVVFIRPEYWNGDPTEIVSITEQTPSPIVKTNNVLVVNNGAISNIASLNGYNWSVNSEGVFTTEGSYDLKIKSYQNKNVTTHAVVGLENYITMAGTSTVELSKLEVKFEDIDPEFNDIIEAGAPIFVTATMANGSGNVFVTNKSMNGFTLNREGGTGTEIDWIVMAYRKDNGPEPVDPAEVVEEEDAVVEPDEDPITDPDPVVDPVDELDPDPIVDSVDEETDPVVDPVIDPVVDPIIDLELEPGDEIVDPVVDPVVELVDEPEPTPDTVVDPVAVPDPVEDTPEPFVEPVVETATAPAI